LEEWLKLSVVWTSNSMYNSPIFCNPKKQGQGHWILEDFRELNQNSHIHKSPHASQILAELIPEYSPLWTSLPDSGR